MQSFARILISLISLVKILTMWEIRFENEKVIKTFVYSGFSRLQIIGNPETVSLIALGA
jgi:hypothetical protein